jgi:hypothetical protein
MNKKTLPTLVLAGLMLLVGCKRTHGIDIDNYSIAPGIEQALIVSSQEENMHCEYEITADDLGKKISRSYVQDSIEKQCGVYLFGNALDEIIADYREDNHAAGTIPKNFKVEKMDLRLELDRSERMLYMYQNFEGKDILLAKRPVAVGKPGSPIINGHFYIRRVIENPRWYGYSDKSKNPKKMPAPGHNNPFGVRMAELSTSDAPGTYDNLLDSPPPYPIRWHLTNKPHSIGKAASSGCFRSHPYTDEELFDALVHYTPHKEGKQKHRGFIIPLDEAIPFYIHK